MATTTEMRLVELVSLKQDITNVIEYLGKKGIFQFQTKKKVEDSGKNRKNVKAEKNLSSNAKFSEETPEEKNKRILEKLKEICRSFGIQEIDKYTLDCEKASEENYVEAEKIISLSEGLKERLETSAAEEKRISDSYNEALSFSNLQVSYSELEHLSFLSIRIGKILKENLPGLKEALGDNAVIIPLGEDSSKIMAVSSKKGRFALDTELKNFGFVSMNIPEDFKGIPQDVLESLKTEKQSIHEAYEKLCEERNNFIETHKKQICELLGAFSVSVQIDEVMTTLEQTSMVYRITGWIPASECRDFMKELDNLTEGRLAIREYLPLEVPSVLSGEEQVPVKLKQRKFISAFERMIFSYGSPLYGSIDPTPFVAIFFTILFGIMFGDCGQGLVFLIMGILMACKLIKVGTWNKFAPIFIAIGVSSSLMGLATGEFFGTEEILEPFALFVTGLFGTPHYPILKVMPSSDPNSIKVIFGIFGVTIALGFVIISVGLVVNMLNQCIRKKWGSALFGKRGLAGLAFYWYAVVFAIRLAAFHHVPVLFDWIVIGITLFFAAFGEPFERLLDGERPVIEEGIGGTVIGGFVELIEVVSNYLSGTISFVRVGAFALAHAVLGFIIEMMSKKCGPVGGLFVLIVGNSIVVVLEGMIVAIQVIRLQYYEFFSKFFNETGREFKPFKFCYK